MPNTKDFNIDSESLFVNAFSEALDNVDDSLTLFPQILTLQTAVVNSLPDSYARESERLKKKYGKENARTREMDDLVDDLKVFKTETMAGVEFVKRSIETISEDNIFHGYVYDFDGNPAIGYKVLLRLKGRQVKLKKTEFTSTVDKKGYFYIDLSKDNTPVEGEPDIFERPSRTTRFDDIKNLLKARADERAQKLREIYQSEEQKVADEKTSDEAAASKAQRASGKSKEEVDASTQTHGIEIESQVTIENKAGKTVYKDEMPPKFTPPKSVFKRYQLSKK
jgi:hypothetical protein